MKSLVPQAHGLRAGFQVGQGQHLSVLSFCRDSRLIKQVAMRQASFRLVRHTQCYLDPSSLTYQHCREQRAYVRARLKSRQRYFFRRIRLSWLLRLDCRVHVRASQCLNLLRRFVQFKRAGVFFCNATRSGRVFLFIFPNYISHVIGGAISLDQCSIYREIG